MHTAVQHSPAPREKNAVGLLTLLLVLVWVSATSAGQYWLKKNMRAEQGCCNCHCSSEYRHFIRWTRVVLPVRVWAVRLIASLSPTGGKHLWNSMKLPSQRAITASYFKFSMSVCQDKQEIHKFSVLANSLLPFVPWRAVWEMAHNQQELWR